MTLTKISLRNALLILFFALLISYALYEARFLILGPQVKITYPQNGAVLDSKVLNLEGRASNIAWISLNGRQIYVDEEGHFSEKLIAPAGISIISVTARDRFGRETEKRVQVLVRE